MNLEKVVFGFFVLLAATLNLGYIVGDIGNPLHHNAIELFAALVVNFMATILKFGIAPRSAPSTSPPAWWRTSSCWPR